MEIMSRETGEVLDIDLRCNYPYDKFSVRFTSAGHCIRVLEDSKFIGFPPVKTSYSDGKRVEVHAPMFYNGDAGEKVDLRKEYKVMDSVVLYKDKEIINVRPD